MRHLEYSVHELESVSHHWTQLSSEARTSLHLAPFSEMSGHHLLDVVCDMYPSAVDRTILSHETSHTSHIISVIRMFISPKYIHIRVEHIMDARQPMQILALLALRAYAARKEEAEVASWHLVCPRISSVLRNVATPRRRSLREVFILAIATGPFVVPDIEDRSCLWRWFGLHRRGVDLWSRWAFLLADDLLHFPLSSDGDLIAGFCQSCGRFFRLCLLGQLHSGR